MVIGRGGVECEYAHRFRRHVEDAELPVPQHVAHMAEAPNREAAVAEEDKPPGRGREFAS